MQRELKKTKKKNNTHETENLFAYLLDIKVIIKEKQNSNQMLIFLQVTLAFYNRIILQVSSFFSTTITPCKRLINNGLFHFVCEEDAVWFQREREDRDDNARVFNI